MGSRKGKSGSAKAKGYALSEENVNIGKGRKAKQKLAQELPPNAVKFDCIAFRWTNVAEPGEGKNVIVCQIHDCGM